MGQVSFVCAFSIPVSDTVTLEWQIETTFSYLIFELIMTSLASQLISYYLVTSFIGCLGKSSCSGFRVSNGVGIIGKMTLTFWICFCLKLRAPCCASPSVPSTCPGLHFAVSLGRDFLGIDKYIYGELLCDTKLHSTFSDEDDATCSS